MNDDYAQLKKILGSTRATVKLLLIATGISVDFASMYHEVDGYPGQFRCKHSIKKTGIKNGQLFDNATGEIPFVPEEIYIHIEGEQSVVKFNYSASSPYILTAKDNCCYIKSDQLPNSPIECGLSLRSINQQQSINGFPADQYVDIIGKNRLAILGFDGCSGWYANKQCRFCDSCAPRAGEQRARPGLNELFSKFNGDITAWLKAVSNVYFAGVQQAYKIAVNKVPMGHLLVMTGNLSDMSLAWDYMLTLTRKLNEIHPIDKLNSYLNMLPPPDSSYLEQAKKLGYRNILFNLEVFGETYFRSICPEKHELVPYHTFIERMQQSAQIFGKGNIRSGFVLGAQPIELLKKGVITLAHNGIASDYSVFTPKNGTPWSNKKRPDLFEIADFTKFLADVYRANSLQPLYCSLSSRSSIINECFEETA